MSSGVQSNLRPLARFRWGFAERLKEPSFWLIQAAVLTISAFHIAVEAGAIPFVGEALQSVHHLPVLLYLAPVAYAGLVYGWEGGVMTGLWSGALATINIVLWHLDGYEWVFEFFFIATVVGMGVVMALPVERERQQRKRAEAAARRLELLNDFAAVALPARTPAEAVNAVLGRLVSLLDIHDAGVALWRTDQPEPLVAATFREASHLSQFLEQRIEPGDTAQGRPEDAPRSVNVVSIMTEHITGHLVATSISGDDVDQDLRDLLSTVGSQLAVRVENAMLLEQEQVMMATYVKLVTAAQEEERRRLARDLHDGPAQQLAILARNLESFAVDHESGGNLQVGALEILEQLRRVARDQRPTLLDHLGLVPALEWLVTDVGKQLDPRIDLVVEGAPERLAPETEVALYRIAQEALRNAERHAGADAIEIAISFGEHEIELSIKDNGSGFRAPSSAGEFVGSGRLGLMGMYERAQLVGGSLDISSVAGQGTEVKVRLSSESSRTEAGQS